MEIPSKEEVLWALSIAENAEDLRKQHDIFNRLTSHPDWSKSARCRCPLCGYESTVTNIHRRCPEAPLTVELVSPHFCYAHNESHYKKDEYGNTVWLGHASVPMYVAEKEKKSS